MTAAALDAARTAEAVLSGRLDPADVVAETLDRIAALNPALNAIVTLDATDSFAQTSVLKARLSRGERPPLAGVPVVVKDAIWVKGWRVTQGSRLFGDFVAPDDNVAIARLRREGAILVGMANMSEFGCKGVTSNPLFGVTRHPLDPRLTPGGSSGGCASALGAEMVPLALGTDGGGSARRPAAHAGIVGFKPSGGVVANGPGFSGSGSLTSVLAPMARTVADVTALFEAIVGDDPADRLSCALPALQPRSIQEFRIAYSPRFGFDTPIDPDVGRNIEAAVDRLAAAGLTIERADPPWPPGATEAALMPLQWAGLAQLHGDTWRKTPDLFDPYIAAQIERGLALSPDDIVAARAMAASIAASCARFFLNGIDLVIGPTTPCVAWPHDRLGPERIGGDAVSERTHAAFTPFFNHGLCAAISIPAGTDRFGLPIGLQIAGPRFADRHVLKIALFAEWVLGAEAHDEDPR